MQRRNTVQKDLVLRAVQEMHQHVTADEVYAYINKLHPNVGRGTVYRNLGILAEEGMIRRVEIPNGPDRFDHTLKTHYHIICIRCGKVIDADMDEVKGLEQKIRDTHGAEILNYDILFKGICKRCKGGDKLG